MGVAKQQMVNLRSKSQEGAYSWHCLDDQGQEIGWLGDLGWNQTGLAEKKKRKSMNKKGFLQHLMGTDTETQKQTLGRALGNLQKKGRKDCGSQRD